MASVTGLSDADESLYHRTELKRSCRVKPDPEQEQTKNSTDDSEEKSTSEEPADNTSDEDFSLNKPKKKKKKKLKVKTETEKRERSERQSKRKKPIIPSFNQVMLAQVRHQLKFIDYDDLESEISSNTDEEKEQFEKPQAPTPEPEPETEEFEPPKGKRRKIIIYPWNPIGITGGRPMPPITDVSELQE